MYQRSVTIAVAAAALLTSSCRGASNALPSPDTRPASVRSTHAQVAYAVTDLGTLGGSYSIARAINASGEVTGIAALPDGSAHASTYSLSGGMVDIGTLGGTKSVGNGINRSGEVAGYSTKADGTYHAFLYSSGKMHDIGDLGGGAATAWAINDAAMVAGESLTADGFTDPFLYRSGRFVDLGSLGGHDKSFYNNAYGINDSKEIVGLSWDNTGNPLGFIWRKGKMKSLGTLGGTYSEAFAINSKGEVTGQAYTSGNLEAHPFRWMRGRMKDLGVLPGSAGYCWGFGINRAGAVVGDCEFPKGEYYVDHAFVCGRKIKDLNALIPPSSGWLLNDAYAINESGQIVGQGTIDGQTHAFLLTPQ